MIDFQYLLDEIIIVNDSDLYTPNQQQEEEGEDIDNILSNIENESINLQNVMTNIDYSSSLYFAEHFYLKMVVSYVIFTLLLGVIEIIERLENINRQRDNISGILTYLRVGAFIIMCATTVTIWYDVTENYRI